MPINKPSKERTLKRINNLFELGFQLFAGAAFQIIAFYSIFLELVNFKKDTFGLMNYGFAIMLGLASTCFSWARNVPSKYESQAKQINDIGIESLYGTIVFLLGSAFKYTAFEKDNKFVAIIFDKSFWMIYIPKILSFLCFIIAAMNFANVATEILRIIAVIKEENWEIEIKNRVRDSDKDNNL